MVPVALDLWTLASLLLWAIVPPLLLLFYYNQRIRAAPPLPGLFLLFFLGVGSGVVSLLLQLGLERWIQWRRFGSSLLLVIVRQLLQVGPVEEGCKLLAVLVPLFILQRYYRRLPAQPSTVLLAALAVGLGFAAQENVLYVLYGIASGLERAIGSPVHALFAAPWGYALGITCYRPQRWRSGRYRLLIGQAWLASVTCHALVNLCAQAWRYPEPERWLGYLQFPFLLWLFWQVDGLVHRSQGDPLPRLIAGRTRYHRYGQRLLAMAALFLGGQAILSLILLNRRLQTWSLVQIQLDSQLQTWLVGQSLEVLIPALLAGGIYGYLRWYSHQRG